MIRYNKKLIGYFITIAVVGLFVYYFIHNIDDFKILLNINLAMVLLLAITTLLMLVNSGIFMKLSLSVFDKKINLNESVKISLIASAGNFFGPAGSGLGIRALYLKKKHGLSYSDYISIVICNYMIVFLTNSLAGIISLLLLSNKNNDQGFGVLLLFFIILFVISVMTFFIKLKVRNYDFIRYKIIRCAIVYLVRISNGWRLLMKHKEIMLKLVLLVIFNLLLTMFGTFVVMQSVGIKLSLEGILLFSVIGSLSLFINITPGNLGVKEAVYILFSSLIGLSVPQILSTALIDRSVLFIMLLLLWVIFNKNINHAVSGTKSN